MSVAAGAFMLEIFDDGGRRSGAATPGALIEVGDEFEAVAVVSIEGDEGREDEGVERGQGGFRTEAE